MQKEATAERFSNYFILPDIHSCTLLHAADDSGDQSDLPTQEYKMKQQTNEHTAGIVANHFSVILLAYLIDDTNDQSDLTTE